MEAQGSEVKRAEPESDPSSSPVLRSKVVGIGDAEGPGAERREAPPASGLPWQNSHNSTESILESARNLLAGSHKRMAFCRVEEIVRLSKDFTLERLGFPTFTFGNNVVSVREAQRRFNSLNSYVLKARYERAIVIWECEKRGTVHLQLVVVLPGDIRSGFDFEAVKRRHYKSAGKLIRAEWAFWLKTAKLYGFGRTELLPIRSTEEAIAKYIRKYVNKGVQSRHEQDRGARIVRFIGYQPGGRGTEILRRFRPQLAWNSDRGWLWRAKLGEFARQYKQPSRRRFKKCCTSSAWQSVSTLRQQMSAQESTMVARFHSQTVLQRRVLVSMFTTNTSSSRCGSLSLAVTSCFSIFSNHIINRASQDQRDTRLQCT